MSSKWHESSSSAKPISRSDPHCWAYSSRNTRVSTASRSNTGGTNDAVTNARDDMHDDDDVCVDDKEEEQDDDDDNNEKADDGDEIEFDDDDEDINDADA